MYRDIYFYDCVYIYMQKKHVYIDMCVSKNVYTYICVYLYMYVNTCI